MVFTEVLYSVDGPHLEPCTCKCLYAMKEAWSSLRSFTQWTDICFEGCVVFTEVLYSVDGPHLEPGTCKRLCFMPGLGVFTEIRYSVDDPDIEPFTSMCL